MRTTIQATTTLEALRHSDHATNAQLWEKVQRKLPNLTLPSLHRITSRLIEQGQIGGRLSLKGQVILDARAEAHSHFICEACDGVKDITVNPGLINSLQEQIGSDIADKSITVYGTCKRCIVGDADF